MCSAETLNWGGSYLQAWGADVTVYHTYIACTDTTACFMFLWGGASMSGIQLFLQHWILFNIVASMAFRDLCALQSAILVMLGFTRRAFFSAEHFLLDLYKGRALFCPPNNKHFKHSDHLLKCHPDFPTQPRIRQSSSSPCFHLHTRSFAITAQFSWQMFEKKSN